MEPSAEPAGRRHSTRMIINADDFGLDAETVRATISCFEEGALTSASIMPNMPATREAVDFALAHPELSFGVHLTFVGTGMERPVSEPGDIPALVDRSGCFLPSPLVRAKAMLGLVPVAQIEREVTAQLSRLREMGLQMSHVDSHCHLHKFGPFLRALEQVLPRFGLVRVRTGQDLYLTRRYQSPTYWYGGVWARRIRQRFRTTDHFFMASDVEEARRIEHLVPMIGSGTVEVGGHPGASGWRRAEALALRKLAARAAEEGHELIGWSQL